MTSEARTESGHYLSAIADAVTGHPGYGKVGINDAAVYTIVLGPVMAVVSDLSEKRLRPERKNLSAHGGVINRLMEEATVLPVDFGTIAGSNKALLKIPKANRTTFIEQLDLVPGNVDLGLHVVLDVPNIFGYMVDRHSELVEMRDEAIGKQHGLSQNVKIEIGRLVDHLLKQDREVYVASVMDVLGSRCEGIKLNPPHEEKEVMHLACFVDRDKQKNFEDGVFEAAQHFDNNYAFDFNGPRAPHNLVNVSVAA